MFKYFQKFILTLCFSQLMFSLSYADNLTHEYEKKHLDHMLSSHPEQDNKDIVGVVLYKYQDNRVYMLLGREDIHNKNIAIAGKFCSLSGFARPAMSYLANMRTALVDESMGVIDIREDYIASKSAFLVKNQKVTSRKEAMTLYALIPAGNDYYVSSLVINDVHSKQSASLLPSEKRKDMFLWLDAEELISGVKKRAMIINAHDIDGQNHKVKLTKNFVEDFIKHPDLVFIINKIKSSNQIH